MAPLSQALVHIEQPVRKSNLELVKLDRQMSLNLKTPQQRCKMAAKDAEIQRLAELEDLFKAHKFRRQSTL